MYTNERKVQRFCLCYNKAMRFVLVCHVDLSRQGKSSDVALHRVLPVIQSHVFIHHKDIDFALYEVGTLPQPFTLKTAQFALFTYENWANKIFDQPISIYSVSERLKKSLIASRQAGRPDLIDSTLSWLSSTKEQLVSSLDRQHTLPVKTCLVH